jgi:hypothetical protein
MNLSTHINSRYSLHNLENYKPDLHSSQEDILHKYNLVIIEFLNFIIESINIKNNSYNKFVIMRGLNTITHVFCMILYYTKNLDIAYYHSQKSFYFYIEFMGQITDEQHSFLQLSSRDAAIFVYKKTIYEINNEYKKNMMTSNSSIIVGKMEVLNINVMILKTIINYMTEGFDFLHQNKKEAFKILVKRIEKISDKLTNAKLLNNSNSTTCYNSILQLVENTDGPSDKYCETVELFIKNIRI